MTRTKSELRACIDELEKILRVSDDSDKYLYYRIEGLKKELETAEEDLFESVVESHRVICKVKNMKQDAAYGQNPVMYYAMAICGEAGEMSNKIVKALRDGNAPEKAKQAVISELPDVIIYSAVLAHILKLDLTKLVNEKVQIVIERAINGYYGGPLSEDNAAE